MIRVNLGKSQAANKGAASFGAAATSSDASDIQRQGALRLLMILIIPLAMYGYDFTLIPELQARLKSKNDVLQSLTEKNEQAKGAVEEIKKFKEDQARLQQQIDTLDNLRKERLREVKILDSLQKDIPEKVWLTKVDFLENKLDLQGMATADVELTSFMETLSHSVFLKEVSLIRSTEQPSDSGLLKHFEISATIDRPTAPPAEVKK